MKIRILLAFISFATLTHAQNGNVNGVIYDENGQQLPAVTVTLKGTPHGTLTEQDGRFEIKNIPEGSYILNASMIGSEKFEQAIFIKNNETTTVPTIK
ncbi:beta-sandwich domain-containing protein [Pseudochryseolinea flava]|uniref:TonB-dependent receptor n=1 Tax=Pseudochryseolinea flava TaxID=2059302 RepID=A0A364XXT9_9BACT|nr:DUF2012 domain-containing protein [Pseudochryseolinea flava]RAV98234.1 hypothetical protein DQQ10_24850 [Pseudochryseolinea flava]